MQKVVTSKQSAGFQVAKAKPTKKQMGKFQTFLAQDKPEIAVNDDKRSGQKNAKTQPEISQKLVNRTILNTDLYRKNISTIRQEIAEFEDEVYLMEDELLTAAKVEIEE